MTDEIRAAVIAVAQSLLPALVLLGVLDWTEDQIAAVMLVVVNAITLGFLLVKTGQGETLRGGSGGPVL